MNIFEALSAIDRSGVVEQGRQALDNLSLIRRKIDEIQLSDSDKERANAMIRQISDAIAVFQQIDLVKISDTVLNLPQDVQRSAEKWAEYGWVPYLPSSNITSLIQLSYPDSQESADEIMLKQLDEKGIKQLIETLRSKVNVHSHNEITFEDAVKSFQSEIWSGCALLLFAIIDSCFLTDQPVPTASNRQRQPKRQLAGKAVDTAINPDKSKVAVFAYTTKHIIERIFQFGNDFDPSIENGVNRNFLAHGMNTYIPTREDCLRLFVLLYNVYVSFDGGFFRW